jgi:hypothetical protein
MLPTSERAKTGGNPQEQDMTMFEGDWSNGAHLWWIDAKPGDRLDLGVPLAKAGRYRLTVGLTKAIDYGIVQFHIDGEKAGKPIDLYNDGVIPTGPISLGVHQLKKGDHKVTVEIVGANEKAVKALVNKVFAKEDVYLGKYKGPYCVSCEKYLPDDEIVEGRCILHKTPVEHLEEETYFFRMSKYAGQLAELYEKNPGLIQPKGRLEEIRNRILTEGLKDVSISRTSFNPSTT